MKRSAAALVVVFVAVGIVGSTIDGRAQGSAATTIADMPPEAAARITKFRDAVGKHVEKFRAQLHAALKAGGPASALGGCSSIASEADADILAETNIEIGRTSLKVRNPENAPDAWETAGLEGLAKQIAAGSDPEKTEIFELTVSSEGQKVLRYMRPIMMKEVCLSCHGSRIDAAVKKAIGQIYNDDKAIGYNLGEMRGAFSLMQPLE